MADRKDHRRWYAVLTAPRSDRMAARHLCWDDMADVASFGPERLAHENLKRLGLMTFYPFRRVKRRRKLPTGQHRIEVIEIATMPRYLFVLAGDESISEINDTIGVATIVKAPFSRRPLPIPDGVMDRLMAHCESGKRIEDHTRTPIEFVGRIGDKFLFSDESPFGGLVATIKSLAGLDGRNEIVAELELLGSERSITVPLSAVGKIVA